MYPLGIYVHIPFCRSKCAYCDFCSVQNADNSKKDAYVKAVLTHIQETAPRYSSHVVDTIYFGGGTPTILGEKPLIRILQTLKKFFSVSKSAEITLEANPESADLKKLRRLNKAGFNRISIGVQSADDNDLRSLGRIHSFKDAVHAVKNARAAGFSNLSLDLMYGLPGQSTESFLSSAAEILKLSPEHISCYALKLEPGTRLFAAAFALPSDDIQADMYEETAALLGKHGYQQYEISNFAKPGYRSRHNQKYWDLSEYLGFGPSSHSFCTGRRFSYTKDIDAYIEGFISGGPVLDEFEEGTNINRLGEYIMLRLRTSDGIDENLFNRKFGLDFQPFAKKFERYIDAGFASREGNIYRLTTRGFFVSNTIILDILSAAEDVKKINILNKLGETKPCVQSSR